MNVGKILKNFWWILTASWTLNNLPDAVIYVKSDGSIEQYNKKAKEIFGFTNEEIQNIKIDDIIKNGLIEINASAQKAKPVLATATIPAREFYVEINVSKRGRNFCVNLRDMTKLTNEIINDEKTLKFNYEKNAMLAKIEDDVKSPITSISGFSQGLLDGLGGQLTEKQAKYVKIINNNAEDLYKFIDKFFEFSSVESSIYEPNYCNFDIVDTLKNIAKDYETSFATKKLGFDIEHETLEKINVFTDLNAIKRIFRNILEVSLSMTETGYISVKLTHPEEVQRSNDPNSEITKSYMHLTIRDTGCGVPEEEMKYLCEPYSQLEKGKKNIIRAFKLGTASILVKRINGSINIVSEVMKGSKYDIVFPIEKGLNE